MFIAAITMATVLILALVAFSFGFYIGGKLSKKEKTEYSHSELSPEERQRTERVNREIKNMLSYDGTAQEEIDV